MIPDIEFRYSFVYSEMIDEDDNPNEKKIYSFMESLEKEWNKKGKNVLKEIGKISGLKWQEKKIICYVVEKTVPFSDPLTLPIYDDLSFAIDILTHELIHQIYIQGDNLKKAEKSWNFFKKKYKDENWNTIIHIPLHAMHSKIYIELFREERLIRNINKFKDIHDISAHGI